MTGSLALQRVTSVFPDMITPQDDMAEAVTSPSVTAGTLELRCHGALGLVEADWRALEAKGAGSVYQRFDWCRIWLESFAKALHASPLIVTVHLANTPIMLLPLYVRRGFGGVRRALFIGEKHANIRVPLVSADGAHQAMLETWITSGGFDKALGAALQSSGKVDAVTLGCMTPTFGGVSNMLYPHEGTSCSAKAYVGTLEPDFAALCAKRRGPLYPKKVRKKMRALEKHGPMQLVEARNGEQSARAFEHLLDQKSARLHAQRRDNDLADPDTRAFIKALARASEGSQDPLLRFYTLEVGERCAAVFAGGSYGGCFSGALNSISDAPELVMKSPGEIIVHRLVETLCQNTMIGFDLGVGEARYKSTWCDPVELRDRSIAITAMGKVLVRLDTLKHWLRAMILGNAVTGNMARLAKFYLKKLKR